MPETLPKIQKGKDYHQILWLINVNNLCQVKRIQIRVSPKANFVIFVFS